MHRRFMVRFRDALDSAPKENADAEVEVPKDKKTYQMDYANRIEAVKEALMGCGRRC